MTEDEQQGSWTEPLHVLVVDDNETILKLVDRALSKEGWHVDTAAKGRLGLQMLLQHDYDVALVDLRMEGMDGFEFLQEARKIWPWLGIVLYSGYLDDHAMDKAHDLGVSRMLSKPAEISLIQTTLEAEAADMRKLQLDAEPVHRLHYQLSILRRLVASGLQSRSLFDALHELSNGISDMLTCDLMGLMVLEDDEKLLLIKNTRDFIHPTLSHIQLEMLARYEALTEEHLNLDDIRIEIEGKTDEGTVEEPLQSVVSVPIIIDTNVHGIMTLASCEKNVFKTWDISFLYHVANHLSTVLMALNQMRQLAINDPLTGLYNRRYLEDSLENIGELSRRYGHSMAVLVLDIDNFKDINDSLGHQVGDQTLREFSTLLKKCVRGSDIIARYGGDEFVVVMPHADSAKARILAQRILDALKDRRFCEQTHAFYVTVSIGVASNEGKVTSLTYDDVMTRADKALYYAKDNGRNQYLVWNEASMLSEVQASSEVSKEFRLQQKEARGHLLLVDDDKSVSDVLGRILMMSGYDVVIKNSVDEALPLLADSKGHFDVLITDLSMPGKDGFALLKETLTLDDTIVRVVLTGNVTAATAIAALRHGAYDYITKPVIPDQLLAVVRRALEFRKLSLENIQYRYHLEEMVRTKSAEASSNFEEMKVSYQFTLETMVAMLDAREHETSRHSIRVRDMTMVLARHLGIRSPQLEEVGRGALVHDIGKIAVPDAILNKPGPLEGDEWEVMRHHPEVGFEFLKSSSFLKTAAEMVLSHHEHYDGSGYPRQLKGEEICLGARIFSVIDAYDAMRSKRIYKSSVSKEEAVEEIKQQAGKQFDPRVVKAFVECIEDVEKAGQWSENLK